jgi:uncharacterized protein (DUF58 family)
MPTARAYSFIVAAVVVYLFANQTQVGWLYVMAALLAGTMAAAGWLSRRALHGLSGERRLPQSALYEGDEAAVHLTLPTGCARGPVSHGEDVCAVASGKRRGGV